MLQRLSQVSDSSNQIDHWGPAAEIFGMPKKERIYLIVVRLILTW